MEDNILLLNCICSITTTQEQQQIFNHSLSEQEIFAHNIALFSFTLFAFLYAFIFICNLNKQT